MKIVPIEGGLGAQIFGVMLYEFLKKTEHDPVLADVRYFDSAPRQAEKGEGINIYAWDLDYYNISIQSYRHELPRLPGLIRRKLFNKYFRFGAPTILLDGTAERLNYLEKAWSCDWEHLFPIQEENRKTASRILQSPMRTTVVHLRRGDYLNVASHVVTDAYVVPLLTRLVNLGIKRIVFLSDSEIPIEFYTNAIPGIDEIIQISSEDVFLSHALLRLASCVVISNSQFSLSAAVLNRQATIFSPRKWFSGKGENLHEQIHKQSDWHLMVKADVVE
jgi:hypothetical protein